MLPENNIYNNSVYVINDNIKEDLKDRSDIQQIVGSRIGEHNLKHAGNNKLKACCPFHQEKTPSFVIDTIKNIYHCFGCGAGGDVISFVQNYDHLTFRDSIIAIANEIGYQLPKKNIDNKQLENFKLFESLFELNQNVADYYQQNLYSPNYRQALQYLYDDRKLKPEIAKKFSLGYAPNNWEELVVRFNRQIELLEQGGLIKKREKSDTYYDRLVNRIIFPIRDEKGRNVGFAGRALEENKKIAKYINSPETILFHKSNLLYGLYELKQTIRYSDTILIVEGYLDVITLHQNEIHNVLATMGTALTQEHINLLSTKTKQLIFCFDGDKAGFNAADRALKLILQQPTHNKLSYKFYFLPDKSDPDDFVRKIGGYEFKKQVAINSLNPIQFLLKLNEQDIEYSDNLTFNQILKNNIKSYLESCLRIRINGNYKIWQDKFTFYKEEFIRQLSSRIAVNQYDLGKEFGIFLTNNSKSKFVNKVNIANKNLVSVNTNANKYLITIIGKMVYLLYLDFQAYVEIKTLNSIDGSFCQKNASKLIEQLLRLHNANLNLIIDFYQPFSNYFKLEDAEHTKYLKAICYLAEFLNNFTQAFIDDKFDIETLKQLKPSNKIMQKYQDLNLDQTNEKINCSNLKKEQFMSKKLTQVRDSYLGVNEYLIKICTPQIPLADTMKLKKIGEKIDNICSPIL